MRTTTVRFALAATLLLTLATPRVFGQTLAETPEYEQLLSRLEAQGREIRQLRARLDDQERAAIARRGDWEAPTCGAGHEIRRLPLVVESEVPPSCSAEAPPTSIAARYFCDYDDGFVIRPFDPRKDPFELKVNGWIQFRHNAFARDVESWTDSAGVTRPVRNRNDFDIERARLVFSGMALTPKLTYFLHLDGDTDGGETVDFFDYWWAYEFSPALQIQVGKRKVPAGRQWLLTARRTRFIDRSMADDFLRPDRTTGLFLLGDLGESTHYELMVGNGYRTSNLPPADVDDRFAFAGTAYCDPFGSYGEQIVDYDFSRQVLVRLGHSFTYAPQRGLADGVPLGESDFVRISDGTRLTAVGALAPGVRVSQYDIYLYQCDLAAKWRGWSVNAEFFFRWLQDISGDGPLPVADLFQRGFYVEGGTFLVPKRLDVNFRYSQVAGMFATSSEYAMGLNWYPLDTWKLKVSFDVTLLDGSPLNNTTTDILVGDDGALFRTQLQAEF